MMPKNTSNKQSQDFRCRQCGAKLAVFADGYLDIRRKDLQVAVEGKASIVCYRCRTLNIVTYPSVDLDDPPPAMTAAKADQF